jgi:hypothetical protein
MGARALSLFVSLSKVNYFAALVRQRITRPRTATVFLESAL